jgi:hypothetical protein
MALARRVERLEQHLAVARTRQPAAGVAEGGVLAPVYLVAELVARQPHGGPQPLQTLARLVYGHAQRLAAIALEPLDRHVGLTAGDPPKPVRPPLAVTQPKPA